MISTYMKFDNGNKALLDAGKQYEVLFVLFREVSADILYSYEEVAIKMWVE